MSLTPLPDAARAQIPKTTQIFQPAPFVAPKPHLLASRSLPQKAATPLSRPPRLASRTQPQASRVHRAPESPSDLRRARNADFAELLTLRADHLAREDRQLVLAVFRDGVRVTDLALAASSPVESRESDRHALKLARTLRRRVRVLVALMLSPRFLFVVQRMSRWTPRRREIAHACEIRGLSQRQAAADLGLSLHAVRREANAINALFAAEQQK